MDDADKLRGAFARGLPPLVAAAAPALFAAAHAVAVPDAAHDEGAVRVLGLAWTGAFRAVDVILAAPFQLVPVGTRALRAALAGAWVVGVAGLLLYGLARALLRSARAGAMATAWLSAVGATTATVSLAWQLEALGVGGSAVGAVLALAPMAWLAAAGDRPPPPSALALLLVLAFAYEPLVGVAALSGASPLLAPSLSAARRAKGPVAFGVLLGLLPAALAVAWHLAVPAAGTRATIFSHAVGEGGASNRVQSAMVLVDEVGLVVAALAAAGLVVGLREGRSRPIALGLAGVLGAGWVAARLGAVAGPSRYGAPILAALAAVAVLSALGMQVVVQAVATAALPFARASAAMIVLLCATVTVEAIDDASVRLGRRAVGAATLWELSTFGRAPSGSVVLFSGDSIVTRLAAARVTGSFREDVTVLPIDSLAGHEATRALVEEPALAPLVRDLLLRGAPEEFALSSLSASRPLLVTYDRRWERLLARHLVPAGLFDRFEPEPRATTDRRLALDAFAPTSERLARALASPFEPELRQVTAALLRARLAGLVAAGDRETAARVIDAVRAIAPGDGFAAEVERRLSATKGVVDLRGLAP